MGKNIEVDIVNKKDLLEKYNKEKASKDMIEYIIKQARLIEKNEKIKIIINKENTIDEDCKRLIINGLKEEYAISKQKHRRNNVKQLYLFIIGIIILFISTLIKEGIIWKEILLIIGWVPIWEMAEVELFPDVEGRIRRRVIRKLLGSDILEREIRIKEIH